MADCSGFIQPLNLECLLVNTFAETTTIFLFIAYIFIAVMGAYFRMMNPVVVIMFGIFAILFANSFGGIYFLVLLIIGLIVGNIFSKLINRN